VDQALNPERRNAMRYRIFAAVLALAAAVAVAGPDIYYHAISVL
jgi:hypothetical protein